MNMRSTSRCDGLSLVELMVAVVIGLVGVLVIFQVFAVSESYRRSTTSGGDAQQNGAVAMYTLERELRQGGWGFNTTLAVGCDVLAWESSIGAIPTFPMVPARILTGPANGSDTIEVNYGSQSDMVVPTSLLLTSTPATPYSVSNIYGFYKQPDNKGGNVILVVESGMPCTLAQVTDLQGGDASNVIRHEANAAGATYNKPGGLAQTYTNAGAVYNLGGSPSHNVYAIDAAGNLTLTPGLTSSAQTIVAEGIVQMKAQYGKDDGVNNGTVTLGGSYTANDGVVDGWSTAQPTTQAQWAQVLAVRVGLVARSANPEKPSVQGGNCDTTTAAPSWMGGSFDLSANAAWQCYRYKVFQTTVPLRNMLWSQG